MSLESGEIRFVLIAGPTASGKSRLALHLAKASGGVVVNADSMQVYDGLRILTARPSDEELQAAPHRLYGRVPPEQGYSVGEWAREAAALLTELSAEGRMPIVCGGTGLYFRALLGGIDDMPSVPEDVRAYWRGRMADEGPARLHVELTRRDPGAAARIKPADTQRIVRALELSDTTQGQLQDVQRGEGKPLLDPRHALKIVLSPPRDGLRQAIADRFDMMMAEGALDEVKRFLDRPGAMGGTAAKAIGVEELRSVLEDGIALTHAVQRAVTRSRQYAKRQDTWFRHQLGGDWLRLTEPFRADDAKFIGLLKAS